MRYIRYKTSCIVEVKVNQFVIKSSCQACQEYKSVRVEYEHETLNLLPLPFGPWIRVAPGLLARGPCET
jgi:hypothetical protein